MPHIGNKCAKPRWKLALRAIEQDLYLFGFKTVRVVVAVMTWSRNCLYLLYLVCSFLDLTF